MKELLVSALRFLDDNCVLSDVLSELSSVASRSFWYSFSSALESKAEKAEYFLGGTWGFSGCVGVCFDEPRRGFRLAT